MAAPAGQRADVEPPPLDRRAVSRAFARERAKRRARTEHQRELRHARVRFWALLGGLLFLAIVLSLTVLDQIQALFGL